MVRWLRRVLVVGLLVGGLTGVGKSADADLWCAKLDMTRPVGALQVCAPMP